MITHPPIYISFLRRSLRPLTITAALCASISCLAQNNPRAYSAHETSTFAFPACKSLSFSLGALDSYLNDPRISLPPTRRNSFQFTMGLTLAFKSTY